MATIAFVVVVVVLLTAFILAAMLGSQRRRPWFDGDLSNLAAIAVAFEEYMYQHDGELPRHAVLVKNGNTVGEWEYISRHDPAGHKSPVATNLSPDDWYKYGSYIFYPTNDLAYGSVSDPSKFVLAYCPPFKDGIGGKDHPTVFLDGRTEMLSKEELGNFISNQNELIEK